MKISITFIRGTWRKLGERINYLGGIPTTKPATIKIGGDLKEMTQDDLDGEYTAIKTYKEHIRLCAEIGEPCRTSRATKPYRTQVVDGPATNIAVKILGRSI
ncbi:MAG: Ferritin-like domain protein [Candidatus Bathyarchaeota archaeon BA1]|nr:MAG: Ferritin-like domain protein [Candidatus Bathyarchaeota archaeon BA1]